jgi:hypothetical protein
VLHLSATVSPSQDAAFMLGIGWTTFNLVMSGFFIPYKVRQQQLKLAGSSMCWLAMASSNMHGALAKLPPACTTCTTTPEMHRAAPDCYRLVNSLPAALGLSSTARSLSTNLGSFVSMKMLIPPSAPAGDPLWPALQPALPVSAALRI